MDHRDLAALAAAHVGQAVAEQKTAEPRPRHQDQNQQQPGRRRDTPAALGLGFELQGVGGGNAKFLIGPAGHG
ncbi:MAG: hypothetical protein CMM61_13285 [Rhodospirillaceae bacterium]|nr:hypothetical protein [Rhodospirillaceae bacterium]